MQELKKTATKFKIAMKFKNETERKEYYRKFADALYLAIKKDFGTIEAFAKEKQVARTILITTLANNLSPYLLRVCEYLRIRDGLKYTNIDKGITQELIADLQKAILNHNDSRSKNGSSRASVFFRNNPQWSSSWWNTIVGGVRITSTARLMELSDYLLEDEIFDYLTIE